MRENFQITDAKTGKTFWIARNMAVTGLITATDYTTKETYFLLERRGPGCPDNIGKLCCVCGYLNWGETRCEALMRETLEETGIDCKDFDCTIVEWKVIDDPNRDAKENVVTRYIMSFDLDELTKALETGKINTDTKSRGGEEGEVDSFFLMTYESIKDLDPECFAFNHREMIDEYMEIFNSILK